MNFISGAMFQPDSWVNLDEEVYHSKSFLDVSKLCIFILVSGLHAPNPLEIGSNEGTGRTSHIW